MVRDEPPLQVTEASPCAVPAWDLQGWFSFPGQGLHSLPAHLAFYKGLDEPWSFLKSGQPRGSKQPIVAPEWLVLPARPGLVSSSCKDQGARIRTGYEHWPPRTTEAPHSSSCPPYPNLQVVPQGSPPQLTAPTTRCRLQGSVYGVGTEVLFT